MLCMLSHRNYCSKYSTPVTTNPMNVLVTVIPPEDCDGDGNKVVAVGKAVLKDVVVDAVSVVDVLEIVATAALQF